jgi:hypothetical protein
MVNDPQELNNLYGQSAYANLQTELEKQLLSWLVQTADVTPFDIDERKMPEKT